MGVTVSLTATVITRYTTCMWRPTLTETHWVRIFSPIFSLIYSPDLITFLIQQAVLILQLQVVVSLISRSTLICAGNTCNAALRGKPLVLNSACEGSLSQTQTHTHTQSDIPLNSPSRTPGEDLEDKITHSLYQHLRRAALLMQTENLLQRD